jgi:hypothetical protein
LKPPCTERYARWCERTAVRHRLLLDYLINLKYVQSVNGNIVTVAGEEIALSRSKKNDFMEAFARYIGGMQS